MKKLRECILWSVFGIICFMIGFTYFSWSVYFKSSIQSMKTLTEKHNQISYDKVSNIDICKKFGIMNDAWVDMVDDQLSLIDPEIIKSFCNSDFDIYVSNIDIAKDVRTVSGYEEGVILGQTDYQKRRIYINQTYEAVESAPIHEIGHWFDYYIDFPSCSEEFEEIFEKEGETFQDVFYNPIGEDCDAQEMFAEGFELYYTDTIQLYKKCPELYNYLDLTIKKFINQKERFHKWLESTSLKS